MWPFKRSARNVQSVMLEGGSWERIAGVMHYQANIEKVAGGRSKEDVRIETFAALVREPNNPEDENAVAVHINGHVVGYLPRDDAKDFQPLLQKLEKQKKVAGCSALVLGGQKKGFRREQHDFGIRIHLPSNAELKRLISE